MAQHTGVCYLPVTEGIAGSNPVATAGQICSSSLDIISVTLKNLFKKVLEEEENKHRSMVQWSKMSVSKTVRRGFESLYSCHTGI